MHWHSSLKPSVPWRDLDHSRLPAYASHSLIAKAENWQQPKRAMASSKPAYARRRR